MPWLGSQQSWALEFTEERELVYSQQDRDAQAEQMLTGISWLLYHAALDTRLSQAGLWAFL